MLYFDMPRLKKVMDPLTSQMKEVMHWSEERLAAQRKEMGRLIAEAANF
jgi:hypothetical protein